MPKRRPWSEQPDAWSWLCHLPSAKGIDFKRMSLAEAADRAVSQLEQCRDAGLPLRPELVQFAALLVRLEGQMVTSGATAAEPLMERAFTRNLARLLADRHAASSEFGPAR